MKGLLALLFALTSVAQAMDGPQPTNALEQPSRNFTIDDLLVGAAASDDALGLLCDGDHDAIVSTSRAIRAGELAHCAENGIGALDEVLLGRDGLVLAQMARGGEFSVELRELFLAAATMVPEDDTCVLVPNPHTTWSDVSNRLPRREIRIYGPNVAAAERSIFVERVMAEGARQIDCLAELELRDPEAFARAILPRHDEVWLDGGNDPQTLAATLNYSRNAIGVFGWGRFQNLSGLQALTLGGVRPTRASVASGRYPLSQPVYLYGTPERLAEPQVRRVVQTLASPNSGQKVRTYGSGSGASGPVSSVTETGNRRVRTYSSQ